MKLSIRPGCHRPCSTALTAALTPVTAPPVLLMEGLIHPFGRTTWPGHGGRRPLERPAHCAPRSARPGKGPPSWALRHMLLVAARCGPGGVTLPFGGADDVLAVAAGRRPCWCDAPRGPCFAPVGLGLIGVAAALPRRGPWPGDWQAATGAGYAGGHAADHQLLHLGGLGLGQAIRRHVWRTPRHGPGQPGVRCSACRLYLFAQI